MKIETERLQLIPINKNYSLDILENFTTEVTEYMYPTPLKTVAEIEELIKTWENQYRDKTDAVYVITDKKTGEFFGIVGLHGLNKNKPELGIWTKISSHGNHYGKEAIGGVIEYAKQLGYKTLIYPVDTRNISSKKIPLFYGGKLISADQLVKTPDGRILEEEIYEILI